MSQYGYRPYDDVYRDGRSWGRVENAPLEDIDAVRQRQWEAYSRLRRDAAPSELSERNMQSYNRQTGRGRERSAPDAYYDDRRVQRRRRDSYSSRSSSQSQSESPDDRRDPRRRDYFRRDRDRAQSEQRQGQQQKQPKRHYDGDMKSRVSKNLDGGGNGILAAAVGAGIGAITARRFGSQNHYDPKQDGNSEEHWKTIGGAVVGGLVANVAEERYRRWSAERGAVDQPG